MKWPLQLALVLLGIYAPLLTRYAEHSWDTTLAQVRKQKNAAYESFHAQFDNLPLCPTPATPRTPTQETRWQEHDCARKRRLMRANLYVETYVEYMHGFFHCEGILCNVTKTCATFFSGIVVTVLGLYCLFFGVQLSFATLSHYFFEPDKRHAATLQCSPVNIVDLKK